MIGPSARLFAPLFDRYRIECELIAGGMPGTGEFALWLRVSSLKRRAPRVR